MKKSVAVYLVATLLSQVVFAGAFDGPYVQLGIGGANTTTQSSYSQNNMRNLGYADFNTSGGSFLGQVQAGYSQVFSGFNIAGNVFYNIGNQKSGGYSHTSIASSTVTENISQNFKLKNTWGVSIEPGYYLGRESLGYLKVSYLNSTLNYGATYQMNINGTPDTTSTQSGQKSMNGIGFGLGLKQGLTENLFAFAEYQYVQYGKSSDVLFSSDISYKPNQNYGWFGVGYRF